MTTAIIAVSSITLPEAIAEAYATRDQAFSYLHDNLPFLTAEQAAAARYAYARANYREGRGLFLDGLAMISQISKAQIAVYAKRFYGFEPCEDTYFTNQQASRIMSAALEM